MKPRRLVWFALLLAACGDSTLSDTPQALCEAICDREQRCQTNAGESREECVVGCLGVTPPASIFKPGVMSGMAACLSNLECGVDDDTCMQEVAVAQDPNWQQSPKLQACIARHDECAAMSGGVAFLDDRCVAYLICTAETVAVVDACLAGACETIDVCLDGVLGGS